MEKPAGGTKNCFLFDPFDDTETMVRVDDLVADLEIHVSPVAGSWWQERIRAGNYLMSIVDGRPEINDKWPKKACFRHFNLVIRPLGPVRESTKRNGRRTVNLDSGWSWPIPGRHGPWAG